MSLRSSAGPRFRRRGPAMAAGCRSASRFLTPFLAVLAGCAVTQGPVDGTARERGPDGTVAYTIQIEASEPEVKIEANGEYLGTAPLTHTLFADRDGTFHNFGSFDYVIRALPAGPGQYLQTKVFRTGGFFTQEDRVPKRIYFDMKQAPGIQLVPSGGTEGRQP